MAVSITVLYLSKDNIHSNVKAITKTFIAITYIS
jgi:hypothetical protein